MRRDTDFYRKFQKLNELFLKLPFDECVSIEQRQNAFYSLANLLLKKGVYKHDGSIQKWRENSLKYLKEIAGSLDESDLQLLLSNQENFFERFIFCPCGKNTSIYAALKERCSGTSFCDIPIDILLNYFTEKTGKSPYEKIPKSVAQVFLLEVENLH
jgi:hypothetical protein